MLQLPFPFSVTERQNIYVDVQSYLLRIREMNVGEWAKTLVFMPMMLLLAPHIYININVVFEINNLMNGNEKKLSSRDTISFILC